MKYQPIVNYAAKLIRKYRTRDPFELAQAMHISVLIQDTFKRQKGAFKLVMNVPFIFINGNLSKTAQTLICAHELGHALLHRRLGALMEFELCDMTTLCELEANIFAAELLLDEREIEDYIRNGYDLISMARFMYTNVNLLLLKMNVMNERGQRRFALPDMPKGNFIGPVPDNAGSL